MKVLIIGFGSIGRQHYKSLKKIKFIKKIKILTNDASVKNRIKINSVIAYNPDYIVISNSTKDHFKTFEFINKKFSKKKVLIEKPLFDKYININFKLNNFYFVGYNMRYHPVILYLKKFLKGKKISLYNCKCTSNLKYWRKNIPYEKSNTACKKGGGALLELSHELDYTKFLIGNYNITNNFFGKLSNLKIAAEDFFLILASNKNSKFIKISANIFSNINIRLINIELKNTTIQGDIINNKIKIIYKKNIKNVKFLSKDLLLEQHRDILKKNLKTIIACSLREAMEINRVVSKIKKK